MSQDRRVLVHANYQINLNGDFADGTHEAMALLQARLATGGCALEQVNAQQVQGSEWVLFHDMVSVRPFGGWRGPDRWLRTHLTGRHRLRNVFRECMMAGLQNRMALFLWEPPSTTPENYNTGSHCHFPAIFTWHDDLTKQHRYHKIVYPQLGKFPEAEEVPFLRKKLLVNVSSNRVSFHPRALYSARRRSIRHFEREYPDEFDLYGWGWDYLPMGILRDIYPYPITPSSSYRGSIAHKQDVMPHYRFSLCYENIRDEPGYVTEKIFDSMRCGCVPIYWGAPNIEEYVTTEAFIDRRQFQSDRELGDYLNTMTEREYGQYRCAAKDYLVGEGFRRFAPAAFVDIVMHVLGLE